MEEETAGRTLGQLREQYDVERQLADQLRHATKEQRQRLYSVVYNELFRRVPHHPQLTRKADPQAQQATIARHIGLLERYLTPESRFVEIGPGDCSLSIEVARRVRHVSAVDVSAEITRGITFPSNLDLIIGDGSNVPVSPATIDVAFSHQLIEHLHPDDAIEHIRSVAAALKPGGVYICVTPNRLNGPHDISKFFEPVARGFHMKEYTVGELSGLFRSHGFSSVASIVGVKGRWLVTSPRAIAAVEQLLAVLPLSMRRPIAGAAPFRQLLGITLLGRR